MCAIRKPWTQVDNGYGKREWTSGSSEKTTNSLLATFYRKSSLADTRTRSAYVYLVLGKAVREKDLENERIRDFIETLSSEEKKTLFYSLFSVDSPKLNYMIFKKIQGALSLAKREEIRFSDAYFFSLATISRSTYREIKKEQPTSASLLVIDLIFLEQVASLPMNHLSELYDELREDTRKVMIAMSGKLFYPRKFQEEGREYWKVVEEMYYLASAPSDIGDIPKFLKVYSI